MEQIENKNSFDIQENIQAIVLEEFFSIYESGYKLNSQFNLSKYYGISKYLKIIEGNIKALDYQKNQINNNILVSNEDKEIINDIYSKLFDKDYYALFLVEFFKSESNEIYADSKEDFLEQLDIKLSGKEIFLNILTFGVLDKSYINQELDINKIFNYLGNFSRRLNIEKDFLIKYKLINSENKQDYEKIIKQDTDRLIEILSNVDTNNIEEVVSQINSGDFSNVDNYFKFIKKIGILKDVSNIFFENKNLLNINLPLYKEINNINAIFNKLNFSSFQTKINASIVGKQVELKNSGNIEDKEIILREIEFLQSIINNIKTVNLYLKSFNEKLNSSFGEYIKTIDLLILDKYKNKQELTIEKINNLELSVELLNIDLEENSIHTDLINNNFFSIYKNDINKLELYNEIISEIDNGNLFKVYINILRYKLNYNEDYNLSSILKYIDETNIVSNYYKNIFTKLENGENISDEILSMQNFLLLVETGSFGTSNFDFEQIKEDINDLKYLFDDKNYHKENSSEKPQIKNKYISQLFDDFRKKLSNQIKNAINEEQLAINYLLENRNIAYVKGNYEDFISYLEVTQNKIEFDNSFINKLLSFEVLLNNENTTDFIKNSIYDYLEKNIIKLNNELDIFINNTIKSLKDNNLQQIDINTNLLEKIKSSYIYNNSTIISDNIKQSIYIIQSDLTENFINFFYTFKTSSNTDKIKFFKDSIKEGVISIDNNELYTKNNANKKIKINNIIDISTYQIYSEIFIQLKNAEKNKYINEILKDLYINLEEILEDNNSSHKSNIEKLIIICNKIINNSILNKKDEELKKIFNKIFEKYKILEEKFEKENKIKINLNKGFYDENSINIYKKYIKDDFSIPEEYKIIISNHFSKAYNIEEISKYKIDLEEKCIFLHSNNLKSAKFIFSNKYKSNLALPIDFEDFKKKSSKSIKHIEITKEDIEKIESGEIPLNIRKRTIDGNRSKFIKNDFEDILKKLEKYDYINIIRQYSDYLLGNIELSVFKEFLIKKYNINFLTRKEYEENIFNPNKFDLFKLSKTEDYPSKFFRYNDIKQHTLGEEVGMYFKKLLDDYSILKITDFGEKYRKVIIKKSQNNILVNKLAKTEEEIQELLTFIKNNNTYPDMYKEENQNFISTIKDTKEKLLKTLNKENEKNSGSR